MNGRLDCAVLRVLGFLALVSVSGGAFGAEVYRGVYTSSWGAKNACESHPDFGGAYCGDDTVNPDDEAQSRGWPSGTVPTKFFGYEGDTFHYGIVSECTDGYVEGDAHACVEDEPECEFGEWPDLDVNGSRAGECMTKCEAAGKDGASPEYMQGASPQGSGSVQCFDGCAYHEQHKMTYYEGAEPRSRSRYSALRQSCSAGDPAMTASAPLDNGCVDDPTGGESFCMEDLEDSASMQDGELEVNDSPDNCGTYGPAGKEERVCMGAAKDSGACVKNGGDYICMAAGELPVVPSVGDNEIANEDGRVTIEDLPPEGAPEQYDDGTATISHGSVSLKDSDGDGEPDEGTGDLEADGPPTAGSDEAEDQAEEQEKSKVCEEAPHLCDGEIPDEVPDVEMPTEEIDVSDLVGPGDYPDVISGPSACPEPQTIAMPESMGGASIDMPYTAFCNFAEYVRPLIISLSYLAAFFIGLRILI